MARTKEEILDLLEKARKHAVELAVNKFEVNGNYVLWSSSSGKTPLQWFKNTTMAQQVCDAWNATFTQYKNAVDVKALETGFAEEYKTAQGAEDVAPVEEPTP